ncbi:hypothetical protein [Actinomycetospora chiangmaiensis]|nr:hypothetical protein [Actinomycetospora chiangmaiensis]
MIGFAEVAVRGLIVTGEPMSSADDLVVVQCLHVFDDDRGLLSVRVEDAG